MTTPRTSGTVEIDGLAVFYETEGDGETVRWWRLSARPRATRLTGPAR